MKKFLAILALVGLTLMGTASTVVAQDTVQLGANLSGANEVGDAGDPAGSGTATVTIDAAANQVCFDIAVAGIDAPTAAHIHSGGADSNGDVVVNFDWANNTGAGCVTSDTAVVSSILNAPQLFYVNVHNEAFPAGAVRGQLEAAVATTSEDDAATTSEDDAATTSEDDAAPAAEETAELAFTGSGLTAILALSAAVLITSGIALVRTSRKEA